MGCFGIGVGRLMGTITEISNDANGIIWYRKQSRLTKFISLASRAKKENHHNCLETFTIK